jgi:hypothetical protein
MNLFRTLENSRAWRARVDSLQSAAAAGVLPASSLRLSHRREHCAGLSRILHKLRGSHSQKSPVTVGSLWVSGSLLHNSVSAPGHFWITLSQPRVTLGSLWVSSGSLFGHPGSAPGHSWVTLGHAWVTLGHCRVTLGSLWVSPGSLLGHAGSLPGHGRVTLGHDRVTLGHPRVTLGSLWVTPGSPSGQPGLVPGQSWLTPGGAPWATEVTLCQPPPRIWRFRRTKIAARSLPIAALLKKGSDWERSGSDPTMTLFVGDPSVTQA